MPPQKQEPQSSEQRLNARRREEEANRAALRTTAQTCGAHIYSEKELDELRQEHETQFARETDMERHAPQMPNMHAPALDSLGQRKEILYTYGGRDYQAVFSGAQVYHHLLFGGAGSRRPFRRSKPLPAPWSDKH